MIDKIEKLNHEICSKGNLSQYENTVGKILSAIYDAKCTISCCDICEKSRIEHSMSKTHIRIGFKKAKEKPIHYIWDILHEFGHYLSGLPNRHERTFDRELQAWELGLEQLKKYPELFAQVEDFEKYRENCLATYK